MITWRLFEVKQHKYILVLLGLLLRNTFDDLTFLFSEQIPPEQVCLQSVQSSVPVSAFGGFSLPLAGQRSEVKKLSLLHLGRGDPSK